MSSSPVALRIFATTAKTFCVAKYVDFVVVPPAQQGLSFLSPTAPVRPSAVAAKKPRTEHDLQMASAHEDPTKKPPTNEGPMKKAPVDDPKQKTPTDEGMTTEEPEKKSSADEDAKPKRDKQQAKDKKKEKQREPEKKKERTKEKDKLTDGKKNEQKKDKANNEATEPKHDEKPKFQDDSVTDVWWSDEMARAVMKFKHSKGKEMVETSQRLEAVEGHVEAVFDGGFRWRVPHLLPSDLESSGKFPKLGGSHEQPKAKGKAKAKPSQPKPVADYILKSIRAKYSSQGSNSPIIKIEVNEDRWEASGRWQQKCQIVLKGQITPTYGMNVARCFCDCFMNMRLVPDRIDYKKCRNALMEYEHDWHSSPLSRKVVNQICLEGFPPAVRLAQMPYHQLVFLFLQYILSVVLA